jgi:hypothetical protein
MEERKALFFYFVPDTTRDLNHTWDEIEIIDILELDNAYLTIILISFQEVFL